MPLFFKKQRNDGRRSKKLMARRRRKVDGVLKALTGWTGDKKFFVNGAFGLADIAAKPVLSSLNVRFLGHP